MSTVNGDSCVSLMQGTLVRPSARYPASIVTDASLKVAVNRVQATLVSSVGSGDTLWTFGDTSRLVPDMLLSIDNEIVSVTSISGNVVTVVRGFDGTIPSPHQAGRVNSANVVAYHHNALVAEVEAIEQALGPNLSNVAGGAGGASTQASTYIWSRTPGGTLSAGSVNTVTLTPVPIGVNGSDQGHWLYVSNGTGAAEPVLIVGGTAVSGAASGTVLFTPANAHSGAWSIGTATSGAQEALQQSCYTPGAPGIVYYGTVAAQNYAPVVLNRNGVGLRGPGIHMGGITMHTPNTDIIQVGDNVTDISGLIVADMTIGVGLTAANTLGYGVNIRRAGSVRVENLRIYGEDKLWRGIHVAEMSYTNILHCYLQHTVDHMVHIEGTAAHPNTGVKIFGCILDSAGNDVIWVGDYANANYIYDGEIYGIKNGYGINLTAAGTYAHFIRGMDITAAAADLGVNGGCVHIYAQEAEITDCQLMGGNTVRAMVSIDGGFVRLIGCEIKQNADRAAIENNSAQLHVTGTLFNGAGVTTRAIKAGAASMFTNITGNSFYQYGSPPIELDNAAQNICITGNAGLSASAAWVGAPSTMVAAGNLGVDNVMQVLASAATITAGPSPIAVISGTTTVLTINGGWNGRRLHLMNVDPGDVIIGGGGNIPAARTLVANNGHLDLVYNAGTWY